MSTAVAESIEGGITLPIAKGNQLFLPEGSYTPFLGWHSAPVLLRVNEIVYDAEGSMVAEPGEWFNMNRKRGSYGRSRTIHRVDLSVGHTVLATDRDDPWADNMEPNWIDRVLRETPDVLYVMAKKGASLAELDWASDQLRDLLLTGPGMKRPQDLNKVQIQSRFLKAIQGFDATGRRNRLAMAAHAVPTLKFAKRRKGAMDAIHRLVNKRRAPLRREILRCAQVASDVLALIRAIKVRWYEPRGFVEIQYIEAADLMKTVVDRPWKPTFDRGLENLREMYKHHGTDRGVMPRNKLEASIEVLALYDVVAVLDTRRSQNDARNVRLEAKIAAKRAEYVAIADQADLIADHLPVRRQGRKIVALPEGDGVLDSPVTPKLYPRLKRAATALRRHDYEAASSAFDDALGAFGASSA